MKRLILSLSFALAPFAAYACSEASEGAPDTAPSSTASASGSPTTTPSPSGTSTTPAPQGDAAAAGGAVLNELSPSKEWVEIVNGGTGAVDLSNWSVADRESDGGAPKTSEAAKLPAGTVLSPKAYLLVQGGGPDAGDCPEGGASYCVHADWGISNKSGDGIFLLSPEGAIIESVDYPAEAVTTKGNSWGRIPNADPNGTFVENVPTPGGPNQAK